jgi:hypothetical protein
VILAAGVGVWLLAGRRGAEPARPRDPARSDGANAPVRVATPPAASRATQAAPATRPDTRAPIPEGAFRDVRPDPAFLRSYLEGRTPDEILPDGTQVFHGMPFEVRQPDGTVRVVPVTLTLQPTDLAPLPAEPK